MWINYRDAVSKALGRLATTFIELYTLVNRTLRWDVFPSLSKIICAGIAAEVSEGGVQRVWGIETATDVQYTAISRAINLADSHPDLASARCIMS